jgi:polyphenol oxidase
VSPDAVFAYRDSRPGPGLAVEVGFTDRRLDLGDHATADVRRAGLRAVADATGATPLLMHQVHGADVQVVERWTSPTWDPHVDALVTARRGVALLTRAADCVPVLMADPTAGVVGAAHAGRPGVAAGVVPAALQALRELGASDVTAWVGPHVCGACYEVPDELRAEVAARVPETYAETSWGTPALDLGAGVTAQLVAAGCAVVQVGRCTREDHELHSYRRDGASAGRFAGVVWMAA